MSSTTVKDIAHDVQRDNPHLGSKSDVEHLIKEVFEVVLERCAKGDNVKVRGFGVFAASVFKGRTLTSPLMKGGAIEFKDQLVLRFRQSQAAKLKINDIADKFKPTTKKTAAKTPDAPETHAEPKDKKGKGKAKKNTPKKAAAKKDVKPARKRASRSKKSKKADETTTSAPE